MARRFKRDAKKKIRQKRAMNNIARNLRELSSKVLIAREHVFNLTSKKVSDSENILLARGLKFIPSPSVKKAKLYLMRDFNEFARKMQCKYMFHDTTESEIHPFRTKSGFQPEQLSDTLNTYLDKTKMELSSLQVIHLWII